MEDPSQSMIFKILNGPQNGVEVALESGEYSIGNDRDDDLQITDVALSGKHGRLRIADGRISISAGSGPISTSTGLMLNAGDSTWHDIDQLDVVSIGATRFAVGKASANWAGLLASASANSTPDKPARADSRTSLNAGMLVRLGLPALAVVVLGVALFVALSGPQGSITSLIKRNSVSDVEVVRGAIAKLPFGTQLKINEEVDGSIFASGYVDNLVQRRAVNDAVAATGVQVRMRLWARDVVRNEVASLIEVRQLPLTFDMTEDGQIVLKGRELDKAKVDQLSALISQQVVGVSGVRSEVETADTVLGNVRELARRAKVGEGVLFRLAPLDNGDQLIEATGAIRNDQIDAWLGFLKSYAATVADYMALRSYVGIEGQTVIVNNANPAVPGSAETADAKDKVPAAVPIILASEKMAPVTVGRRVPLEMFLNNQTSYKKLLDAVAPSAAKAEADKADSGESVSGKTAKADNEIAGTQDAEVDDGEKADESQATSVQAGARTDSSADPAQDKVADAGKDGDKVRLDKANPSETSLMEVLGVRNQSGEDGSQVDVALADTPPDKSDASSPALAFNDPTPDRPAEAATTEATAQQTADKDNKAAVASKVVTPPILDVAQTRQSDDADLAVRQLQDATAAILKLNNSKRLIDLLGPERGKDVQQALDRISGTVKQAAALRSLIAEKAGPQDASACWPGSGITPDVLPTLIFWLDLLSISENVSIDSLFIDNYGLVLEAGLSPDRVRECLVRQQDPAMAKLAASSIYLEEVGRNPDFIRFLLRSSPTSDLDLAGASTIGVRYVQLDNGDKLTEGEAPSLDSRIASIGDLGVLVRIPSGYVAEIYPKTMPWIMR